MNKEKKIITGNFQRKPSNASTTKLDDGIEIFRSGIWQDTYRDSLRNKEITLAIDSPINSNFWICHLNRNKGWSDGSSITDEDCRSIERNIVKNCIREGFIGILEIHDN